MAELLLAAALLTLCALGALVVHEAPNRAASQTGAAGAAYAFLPSLTWLLALGVLAWLVAVLGAERAFILTPLLAALCMIIAIFGARLSPLIPVGISIILFAAGLRLVFLPG